tara:strand:- start:851 stop:1057 length:207 start_codon:yes stop_codon:yes gene_type:complete
MIETLPHYKLKYVNAKGKERHHEISRPFDVLKNRKGSNVGFVAYSYGKGIRSFRHDRVIEMNPTEIPA